MLATRLKLCLFSFVFGAILAVLVAAVVVLLDRGHYWYALLSLIVLFDVFWLGVLMLVDRLRR
jgi:uncharacterized membrane protein YvlD (DUF360 family)